MPRPAVVPSLYAPDLAANALPDQPAPVMSGLIYLFVEDVDALAARLAPQPVPIEWGPETQDYGLRELAIRDLNGYRLVFATDA